METFLEFVKEVFKGVVRAISVFLFSKTFLERKKTTLSRRKQKGDPQNKD